MKKTILFALILLFASRTALSQDVGIGTTTPVGRLEVRGAGNSSATNNLVLRNLAGDTLFRMRNNGSLLLGYNGPTPGRTLNFGGTGANFFINDDILGGAIFPTDTSLVMWSQTGDNLYVILQPTWGKVGIGTYSPKAKLDVNGPVILGENGTIITQVLKRVVTKNLASISANNSTIETFAIAGANIGSSVSISPELALPNGLIIAYARVSATGTVEVRFTNVTGIAINPGTMNFYISVIE